MKLSILLIFISGFFYGCDKCRYVDPSSAYSSFVNITYKNKTTNDYLITEGKPDYRPEDYKITADDGSKIDHKFVVQTSPNVPYTRYFKLAISGYVKSQQIESVEECRRIFIDHKDDRDTLDLCYRIKKTICNGSTFENFEMHYNGKLISRNNDIYMEVTIEK